MKNPVSKLSLLLAFIFVMVPGMLLSTNLDQLERQSHFLNFSIAFCMLIFGLLAMETLRKIAINEQIDFNQNKIDIIQSSFILMDGNEPIQEESYDDIEFNYMVTKQSPPREIENTESR